MADIQKPKLLILAVLADRKPVDLHIFRNYKSAEEILNEHNGTSSNYFIEEHKFIFNSLKSTEKYKWNQYNTSKK